MSIRKHFIGVVLLLSFGLAACQSAITTQDEMVKVETQSTEVMTGEKENEQNPGSEPMEESSSKEISSEHADESSMEGETTVEEEPMQAEENTEMVELPNWFDFTLTNVRTDDTFSINEYHGKVVLVETLAMWCSNCRKQQNQVIELHALLGERNDFISVGLDIDPNENGDQLKDYTTKNGFDWIYAIASADLGREIANLYGSQFLNPPSTPMLIVDRQGNVHLLPFGIKSAAQLKEALDPFLEEGM